MNADDLNAGFADGWAGPPAPADVAAVLQRHLDEARAAYPELSWSPRAFAAFVAARIPADADPVDALTAVHGADLFLAGLCVEGDDKALARFDADVLAPLAAPLRSLGATPAAIDEVRQQLRAHLFADPPRIGSYSGRARLARWTHVAAVRTYHKLRRKPEPEDLGEDLAAGFAEPTADAELEYFKQLYRGAFKDAFSAAIEGLPKRDRNLLRHAIAQGLTLDQIGRIYHVSRATAGRQVAKARSTLIESTRAILRQRLDLGDAELQSVLRLIQSEVDLSIRRNLG